jgi:ABC-type polysaccharide/polyol phosphate transport system ATPase subunit
MSPSPKGTVASHGLWKRFRAERPARTLRTRLSTSEGSKEFRRKARRKGYRWALRDVNFACEPGDALGLIGRNGSGKSTLLKILGRVMYPYAGSIDVQGRVGALIEVRAGIHPELTGRENVQLYGSLLGLPRKEVARRFDEIIDFAEVNTAVDRQVKFYSSGMQMRLGFAVAAFLEPDVLLVDEVLAVGDASFQQKCLDRMRAVLDNGTTLVFVSHDLAAVESTCRRVVWLDDGILKLDGDSHEVVGAYRRAVEEMAASVPLDSEVRLLKAEIETANVVTDGPLAVRLRLEPSPLEDHGRLVVGITDGTPNPILLDAQQIQLAPAGVEVLVTFERLPLPRGIYYVWVGLFRNNHDLLQWHPAARFELSGPNLHQIPPAIVRLAPIATSTTFDVEVTD